MSLPRTILVTGGIGSGKSAVCSWLRSQGVRVYDSDAAAKEIYTEHPWVVAAVERALSCRIRSGDGSLDRKLLASVIFSDPSKLSALEAIVHPLVLEDFKKWKEALPESKPPFVAMESAIALSKPVFRGVFDAVLLVDAPLELRVERVCARGGISREEALSRMASQAFDRNRADEIIVNDSSLKELYLRCEQAVGRLTVKLE